MRLSRLPLFLFTLNLFLAAQTTVKKAPAPAAPPPQPPAAIQASSPDSLDRDFVSGGYIRMQLSAGTYRISASADGKIHVKWSINSSEILKRVKVSADVNGTQATIRTDAPDNEHFRVDIQVPSHSDLLVRFTAGDFQIDGIEGNKDVAGYAGNLSIDVGDVGLYKEVHASVTTGDLNARPFHVSKGGLWRSFDRRGGGIYILRVKLLAGDLKLYARERDSA